MIGMVVAGTLLLAWLRLSNDHPLVKEIGLPVIDKRSESDWNASRRAFVYSKAGANSGRYELICEKVGAMFGDDHFGAGVELKEAPRPILIDGNYTKNPMRAFRIESRDLRSIVWVAEYEDYVAVFLADSKV